MAETAPGRFTAGLTGARHRALPADRRREGPGGRARPRRAARVRGDDRQRRRSSPRWSQPTRGGFLRLEDGAARYARRCAQGRVAAGRGWIGITPRGAYRDAAISASRRCCPPGPVCCWRPGWRGGLAARGAAGQGRARLPDVSARCGGGFQPAADVIRTRWTRLVHAADPSAPCLTDLTLRRVPAGRRAGRGAGQPGRSSRKAAAPQPSTRQRGRISR